MSGWIIRRIRGLLQHLSEPLYLGDEVRVAGNGVRVPGYVFAPPIL